MRGEPTDFWGKLDQDEEGRVLEWNPVEAHCADVVRPTRSPLSEPPICGILTCDGHAQTAHRPIIATGADRQPLEQEPTK